MAERWHPVLNADEIEPGVWRLLDAYDKPYADIALRRVQEGALVRYRVEFQGELIGWATTLKGACMVAHRSFLRTMTAPPFLGYPKYHYGE